MRAPCFARRRRPGARSRRPGAWHELVSLALIGVATQAVHAEPRETLLSESIALGGRSVDSRGLTTWTPYRRRTPTGFLYPFPLDPLAPESDAKESWQLRAFADVGWLFTRGNESEARFREYADPSDGWWLRRFSIEGRERVGGFHFAVAGGSVGRPDGTYRIEAGRYGRFRLRIAHDGFDHTYADNARILHAGSGTGSLTLPPSLPLGLSDATTLANAIERTPESRIAQSKQDSSLDLRVQLQPGLVWRSGYRLDRRDGERPFGGTLGTTFGQSRAGSVIETLEPIQSRTHIFSTGIEFARPSVQANLLYSGSLYENHHESLTWENPFPAIDLGFLVVPGVERGRSALPPDNARHQISGDLATALPLDGRFTATVAWARMSQDESLLPATLNPNVTAFGNLARSRADANVDTLLVRAAARIRPIRPWTVDVAFRFRQRDNDTNYRAFDVESGRYGYVIEDQAPTDRVGAVPVSYRRWSLRAGSQWRLDTKTRLGLEYEHEVTNRTHRARAEVRDDRIRIEASTRAFAQSTHRISYEFGQRSGSGYDPGRDQRFYVATPGAVVVTTGPGRSLRQFRQVDLASAIHHEVELRSNFLLGPATDLVTTARFSDRDFGSDFGVRSEQAAELGIEANYLPSPRADLRAFASVEWRDRKLRTIDSEPGPSANLSAGGPRFPLSNRWSWNSLVRTLGGGVGTTLRPMARLEFDLDYRIQYSREAVETDFAAGGAATTASIDAATATRDYPAQRTLDHILDASATIRWSERIATTLVYRFQQSEITDFQQRGLVPLVNQNLYLAGVDRDFVVHVLGINARFSY